jgi:DNA (cytosine-5)-methyltransferase 1
MTRAKYRLLDLFSGIGGFSLGLERSGGFETVAFCEIDPFCRRVLARHWPKVPCYDDIRTLTAERLAADGIAVDAICGGFPCQDISVSGTKLGLEGERSGLWFEYVRIIRELRPYFVFVENSTELLSGWLGDILAPLATLGYDAEWECIPARAVGAPHRRDRIWIIANAAGKRRPRQGEYLKSVVATPDAFEEANRLKCAIRSGNVPFVCRGHDGISPVVDRAAIHALGNAVVPQISELIGRAIMAADSCSRRADEQADSETQG